MIIDGIENAFLPMISDNYFYFIMVKMTISRSNVILECKRLEEKKLIKGQ